METRVIDVVHVHAHASTVRKEKSAPVTTYSFSCYEKGEKIFDHADPMEAAAKIVDLFPSQSKEIAKSSSINFSGDIPKEIDILHMDSSAQLVLKQAIANCISKMEKVSILV